MYLGLFKVYRLSGLIVKKTSKKGVDIYFALDYYTKVIKQPKQNKMLYYVEVPIVGSVTIAVTAAGEKEAISQAVKKAQKFDLTNVPELEEDDEVLDYLLEAKRVAVTGNVFYGETPEACVTEEFED